MKRGLCLEVMLYGLAYRPALRLLSVSLDVRMWLGVVRQMTLSPPVATLVYHDRHGLIPLIPATRTLGHEDDEVEASLLGTMGSCFKLTESKHTAQQRPSMDSPPSSIALADTWSSWSLDLQENLTQCFPVCKAKRELYSLGSYLSAFHVKKHTFLLALLKCSSKVFWNKGRSGWDLWSS